MNFKEFIKYLKEKGLDPDFNDLSVMFYDPAIVFELYETRTISIEYNGDVDDITVTGLEASEGETISFSVIKDVYNVMQAIKDNHYMLNEFLK